MMMLKQMTASQALVARTARGSLKAAPQRFTRSSRLVAASSSMQDDSQTYTEQAQQVMDGEWHCSSRRVTECPSPIFQRAEEMKATSTAQCV
eukprot:1153556-Pelagomonas_calceolata.AAC.2